MVRGRCYLTGCLFSPVRRSRCDTRLALGELLCHWGGRGEEEEIGIKGCDVAV